MNALDIAVLAIVALSALFAFARGFVREALSILAWVGAAAITIYGFGTVYRIAIRHLTTPLLADLAAGAGLFLSSLIVLTIVTSLIARRLQAAALSSIDRTLGLIFGVFRGAVLVSLAWLLLDISVPPGDRPGWIKQARSAPFLAQGAEVLRDLMPPSLRASAISAGEEAQRALEQAKEYDRAMHPPPVAPAPGKSERTPRPGYDHKGLSRLMNTTETPAGQTK